MRSRLQRSGKPPSRVFKLVVFRPNWVKWHHWRLFIKISAAPFGAIKGFIRDDQKWDSSLKSHFLYLCHVSAPLLLGDCHQVLSVFSPKQEMTENTDYDQFCCPRVITVDNGPNFIQASSPLIILTKMTLKWHFSVILVDKSGKTLLLSATARHSKHEIWNSVSTTSSGDL